ncbi:MAG: lysophospholipid acyltransferase family protein [Campylobacter sp.]|nr:lysophospholipid acyltransferase family protein [Campylobacter sp.]
MANCFKNFKLNLAVFFIYGLIWLIFLTCKKTFSDTKLPENPCVVVFWHGRLAFMSFAYLRYWRRDYKGKKHGKVIISDHRDGELITRIIKFFGIGTIRGSSSKGGARALIDAFRQHKNGVDVIITPDGPRGPRHSIADGAVVIAQKTKSKIYALNYEASSFWQLKSWDEMIIPKPFSTINFSLSQAFDISDLQSLQAKEKIQNVLWLASENDGGKSVEQNKNDFVENLKKWWVKNKDKDIKIDENLKDLL